MTYVEINGLNTWYTDDGVGEPVVLLHGGMSHGTGWKRQIEPFAERYRVITPDRRGHGRTADTEEPFSYAAMAEETAGVIDALTDGAAHLVGWSDGAITALHLALSRPQAVRRMVLIGANFHAEAMLPSFDLGDDPDADDLARMRDGYATDFVDGPGRWPTFLAKTNRLWRTEPTWSPADLGGITAPTLVLIGDDEPFPLSHSVELFEALTNAQFAVIPGASHAAPMEKPELVNRIILDFLAETGPPQTFMPVRRAAT